MKMKYEPIGNTLLVEAIDISTTIAIPGSVQPERYTIVARGSGTKIPKELKTGDTIIISGYVTPIKDTKYGIATADSVLAKISE